VELTCQVELDAPPVVVDAPDLCSAADAADLGCKVPEVDADPVVVEGLDPCFLKVEPPDRCTVDPDPVVVVDPLSDADGPTSRSLLPSPVGQVLFLSANVLQWKAADNSENSCIDQSAWDHSELSGRSEQARDANKKRYKEHKGCERGERRRRFARRVAALAAPLDEEGMRYVPDAVALQEVYRNEAGWIASLLTEHTGYQFELAIHSDDVGAGIESDVAVLYNVETLRPVGNGGKVTNTLPPGETETPKTQVFMGFQERLLSLATAASGEMPSVLPDPRTVALASIHFTTGRNWANKAAFSDQAKLWTENIVGKIQQTYPGADMIGIAGDFNEPRCRGAHDPRGVADFMGPDLVEELDLAPLGHGEPIDCTPRPFWSYLTSRGYHDTVLATNATQQELDAQYRHGDWKSGMRIDHVFVKGSSPEAASHDVSCGETDPDAQERDPRFFRKNCTWLLNGQRYSDHRLVWSLNTHVIR
jgi:hypothetical protein